MSRSPRRTPVHRGPSRTTVRPSATSSPAPDRPRIDCMTVSSDEDSRLDSVVRRGGGSPDGGAPAASTRCASAAGHPPRRPDHHEVPRAGPHDTIAAGAAVLLVADQMANLVPGHLGPRWRRRSWPGVSATARTPARRADSSEASGSDPFPDERGDVGRERRADDAGVVLPRALERVPRPVEVDERRPVAEPTDDLRELLRVSELDPSSRGGRAWAS